MGFLTALAPSKWHILALVFCLAITSCGLEEPYGGLKNNEGVIEFVARPVGFNNQTVHTKSTPANDIESKIYSCYLLVFDTTPNTGNNNLIYCSGNLISESATTNAGIPAQTLNINKNEVKSIKACYVVNVPNNFVYKSDGTAAIGNTNALENAVLDHNHFRYATHSSATPIGTPEISINGGNKLCIPAYGEANIDLSNGGKSVPISIKRLFAKVTVSLDMEMGTLQAASYYTLISYKISNLPKKVSLIAPSEESTWVKDPNSFNADIVVGSINKDIYNSTSAYTFTLYVPEYYLVEKASSTSGYGDAKYKPTMFDSSKHPVYLTLNGMYHPINVIGEEKKSMKHLIYFGENASTSFTLKRNVHYTNLLVFKGVSNSSDNSANLDHRVIIDETFNAVDVYGESANCYIVNAAGTYVFPAVKGAHKGDLTKLADKYKCTQEGAYLKVESKTSGIEINDLNYNKASAEFSFTVPSAANGNAVVALAYKDSKGVEQIEWSWHIWFDKSAEIFNQEVFEIATETMPDDKTDLMNRNLGTSPSTLQSGVPGLASDGTYYLYGLKEPFFNGAYQGGGRIIGTNGQEEVGWNDSKSPTDPCPPSYKVPSSSTWDGANYSDATREHAGFKVGSLDFLGFRYWNLGGWSVANLIDDIYYPYSRYIDTNQSKSNESIVDDTYTTLKANDYRSFSVSFRTDEQQIGSIETGSLLGFPYETQTIGYDEYEYTDFQYKLKLYNQYYGYLWCADNAFLNYSYKKNNNAEDFQIVSCQCRSRSTIRQQQRIKDKWVSTGLFKGYYDWGNWKELTRPTTGDWSSKETVTASQNNIRIANGQIGSINNDSWKNDLKSNQSNRTIDYCEIIRFSNTSTISKGYQVRCVVEE